MSSICRNRPMFSRSKHYVAFDVPERIHVLGTGNIGKFVAHSIKATSGSPPVTLLFHKPSLIHEWEQANQSISLIRYSTTDAQTNFTVELAPPESSSPQHRLRGFDRYVSQDTIHNLIVCVKAHQTVNALTAVKHRLTAKSSVLFLQNGMGIMEEVNEKLFPDPETRPNMLLGIISHGLHNSGTFSVTHAGHGTISIGFVPRIAFKDQKGIEDMKGWSLTSRHLLRTITRVPVLAAVGLSPTELLQAQLEKLAVNCVINPLTVMLDSRNGSILTSFAIRRVMRLLIAEISLVIRSLPELRGIPNVERRFSPRRLESIVRSVANSTAENVSSMLQDTRRGAQTEIQYINGYIVKRGEELGIKPVLNYMMMQMVLGKQNMISQEVDNYVPFTVGT